MTNATIVMLHAVDLMEKGLIGTTGREIVTADGQRLPEPEPIHTFATWKALGYKVRKGEHAIAKFPIWKHTAKKTETEEEGAEVVKSRMFMKTACWFSMAQVEKLENAGA